MSDNTTTFSCPHCGQSLESEDDLSGVAIDCPTCSKSFTLPILKTPPQQTTAPKPPADVTCPRCHKPMPLHAVLCVNCGFDLRTGENLLCEAAPQSPKAGSKLRLKQPERAISHCINCRTQIYDTVLICPQCGASQVPDEQQRSKTKSASISNAFVATWKNPIRRYSAAGVLCGLVLISTITNVRCNSARQMKRNAVVSASRALIQSEELVWSLQGRALTEARACLQSKTSLDIRNDPNKSQAEKEIELRRLLAASWSRQTKSLAIQFTEVLNPGSTALLTDAARRKGISVETFVLEWISYEAANDFALIHDLWQQRNNIEGSRSKDLIDSFVSKLHEPPDIAKGVKVLTASDTAVLLSVYGAIIDEAVYLEQSAYKKGVASIVWRSNYDALRCIRGGEDVEEYLTEEIQYSNGRWGIDYEPYFVEYMKEGDPFPWALVLTDQDPLLLARLVGSDAALAYASDGGGRFDVSFDKMYKTLSRSVPMIEAIGVGQGSGFLVQHGEKLYVASNRHVIEGGEQGFNLHFFADDNGAAPIIIRRSSQNLTAVHAKADLALLDITDQRELLRSKNILPLALSSPTSPVPVGSRVFVIGHPGGGGETLTATLTDGIVSATRTIGDQGPCVQITAPINPGNSGGPLFTGDGKVAGVVTFTFRKGQGDIALEGLNFAVAVSTLQDLLVNPNSAMPSADVAQVLRGRKANSDTAASAVIATYQEYSRRAMSRGFRPYTGNLESSSRVVTLAPGEMESWRFRTARNMRYACFAVAEEGNDIDLVALDRYGNVTAVDRAPDSTPTIDCAFPAAGYATVAVINNGNKTTVAVMALFDR